MATYTWSHSIDDSSDLQTLLKPQNNRNFRAERSDSLFDQRHRFVFSAVMGGPDSWRNSGGVRGFLHGFTLAPIVEFGSGRPFNILAVGDSNGDFQSIERTSDRSGRRHAVRDRRRSGTASRASFPQDGSLPRNFGITHNYFSVDARLSRKFRITENVSLDIIAEGFNLFNRFNEAAGNPFYHGRQPFGERKSNGRYYSQPTSAFDPRQFQFGVKLNF